MYALNLTRRAVKSAAATITTPQQALDALDGATTAAADAIAAETSDAAEQALTTLAGHVAALQDIQPADAEDAEGWQPVADAMDALVEWLEQPAEDAGAKATLTRDEKIKLAVALARKGKGRRRGDPAEAIISTFEKGLVGLVKITYHALRLTVLGIAAVSHAAINGVIHVHDYWRNGHRVSGYDREPAKG